MLDGTIETPKQKRIDGNLQTIRAIIPLVLIGYLLTLIALPVAGWPTGQFGQQNVEMVPHFDRLTRMLLNEQEGDPRVLPRRILDVAFYVVLLVGFVFIVLSWRRGKRSQLLGLIGVGILGLSYAGGMALYSGAFLSTCGFLLILFGGIVMLTAARDDEDDVVEASDMQTAVEETSTEPSELTDSEQTQI